MPPIFRQGVETQHHFTAPFEIGQQPQIAGRLQTFDTSQPNIGHFRPPQDVSVSWIYLPALDTASDSSIHHLPSDCEHDCMCCTPCLPCNSPHALLVLLRVVTHPRTNCECFPSNVPPQITGQSMAHHFKKPSLSNFQGIESNCFFCARAGSNTTSFVLNS